MNAEVLVPYICEWLQEKKAEDIIVIDVRARIFLSDFMVIASGGSSRQLYAMMDFLRQNLKKLNYHPLVEGAPQCDWVLIDTEDVMIHLFKPEVRSFYNLEKMWSETETDSRGSLSPSHYSVL